MISLLGLISSTESNNFRIAWIHCELGCSEILFVPPATTMTSLLDPFVIPATRLESSSALASGCVWLKALNCSQFTRGPSPLTRELPLRVSRSLGSVTIPSMRHWGGGSRRRSFRGHGRTTLGTCIIRSWSDMVACPIGQWRCDCPGFITKHSEAIASAYGSIRDVGSNVWTWTGSNIRIAHSFNKFCKVWILVWKLFILHSQFAIFRLKMSYLILAMIVRRFHLCNTVYQLLHLCL